MREMITRESKRKIEEINEETKKEDNKKKKQKSFKKDIENYKNFGGWLIWKIK